MARINLLPWREQLREERKQRFLVVMLGTLIIAGGLVFLGGSISTGPSLIRTLATSSSRRKSRYLMRVSRKSVSSRSGDNCSSSG